MRLLVTFMLVLTTYLCTGDVIREQTFPQECVYDNKTENTEETLCPYIVNGQVARREQFRFLVSIRVGGLHNCGASLIRRQWVVAAAHCSHGFKSEDITVVAGTTQLAESGQEYEVEALFPHPEYDRTLSINDVLLIKLKKEVVLNYNVQLIEMYNGTSSTPGTGVSVGGWGYTGPSSVVPSPTLMYVNMTVVDHNECSKRWLPFVVRQGHICVEGNQDGTCAGDSGGPYAHNGILIGVHTSGDRCRLEKPSFGASVPFYLPWFTKIMEENS